MAIVKVRDDVSSHPSVRLAGNAAFGLWTRLACWAASHQPGDWDIPSSIARKYGTATQIRRMTMAGLATETADGYQLNGELLRYAREQYRAHIPQGQRDRIYARDGHACLGCGATEDLTLDHIYPWSLGGPDTDDNLRTLCRSCNSKKGAKV